MGNANLWIELGPSQEYRDALAEAIIQWAYFETEFDGLLWLAMLDPATKLTDNIPFSFKRRLKLLKDSAKISFVDCPQLVTRILQIHDDAKEQKKLRDHISHCRWPASPKHGSMLTYIEGISKFETREITLNQLNSLAFKTSELTRRAMAILLPIHSDYSFPLSKEEVSFLRDYRHRNYPIPQIHAKGLLPPQSSQE
jgi:hypothetical protein